MNTSSKGESQTAPTTGNRSELALHRSLCLQTSTHRYYADLELLCDRSMWSIAGEEGVLPSKAPSVPFYWYVLRLWACMSSYALQTLLTSGAVCSFVLALSSTSTSL